MNILELLKNNYSQYKITDSSNRDLKQIYKITEICKNNPNIMVYIKRNQINNQYFEIVEMMDRINGINDPEPIETIILNKDNYVYVKKTEQDPIKVLRCINKNLITDEECCVCYEKKSSNKKLFLCTTCQIPICVECTRQITNKSCPHCKNVFEISNNLQL